MFGFKLSKFKLSLRCLVIFSFISAIFVTGFTLLVLFVAKYVTFDEPEKVENFLPGVELERALWIIWIYACIISIVNVLLWIELVKWYKSTRQSTDVQVETVLVRAKHWLNLQILCTISGFLIWAISYIWIGIIFTIANCWCYVYPQWKFVKKLESIVDWKSAERNIYGDNINRAWNVSSLGSSLEGVTTKDKDEVIQVGKAEESQLNENPCIP